MCFSCRCYFVHSFFGCQYQCSRFPHEKLPPPLPRKFLSELSRYPPKTVPGHLIAVKNNSGQFAQSPMEISQKNSPWHSRPPRENFQSLWMPAEHHCWWAACIAKCFRDELWSFSYCCRLASIERHPKLIPVRCIGFNKFSQTEIRCGLCCLCCMSKGQLLKCSY